MKRIESVAAVLFISLIPFGLVSAQVNKDEKKVKIIIADKSGTRVITDTIFPDKGKNDTLIIKDGKVVYIGKKSSGDQKSKEIRVITRADRDGDISSANYIYVSDGKIVRSVGDNDIDILIDNDLTGDDMEKTKFIIAKNGITVSIEGKDEEKIKELATEIEEMLGVKPEGSDQGRKKN